MGEPSDRFGATGMNGETKFDRETYRSKHPHRIFPIPLFRITDQSQHTGLVVLHAADVINYRKVGDVVIQRVDRKISAESVFFDGSVDVVPQNAAVLYDAPLRAILTC